MEPTRVTASGLVYLFGEEFAKPWSRVSTLLLLGSPLDAWALGWYKRLPYSGRKVNRKELANRLFEAAFVSLAQEGYVSLATEERKLLPFVTREVATIAQQRAGDDLLPSLERAVMDALTGDPKEDWVQAVVERVIEGRPTSPWKWVVEYVRDRLLEAGYLRRQVDKRRFQPEKVHWSAHEEAIAPLAGEVEPLKASLETFGSTNPDLHKRLVGGIRGGFLHSELWADYWSFPWPSPRMVVYLASLLVMLLIIVAGMLSG